MEVQQHKGLKLPETVGVFLEKSCFGFFGSKPSYALNLFFLCFKFLELFIKINSPFIKIDCGTHFLERLFSVIIILFQGN